MEQKIYFDVEKISVIEVRGEKLMDYEFYPERLYKKTYILFGLIPIGAIEYLPPRWSSDGGRFWTPDTQMKGYSFYRIDEASKKIYNRSQVTIHLGYKETVSKLFDTTEEAIEWANHVIKVSGKNLELIIDK
jgi:hypothetical protein